jgi:hypothetical protein
MQVYPQEMAYLRGHPTSPSGLLKGNKGFMFQGLPCGTGVVSQRCDGVPSHSRKLSPTTSRSPAAPCGASSFSAPINIPRAFPRRPGPPRSGGVIGPPSSGCKQFLERGSIEAECGQRLRTEQVHQMPTRPSSGVVI